MVSANNTSDDGYKPGDKAMDFSLKSISGKMVSMSDYKDVKGFIIIFMCNHCPYVKLYEQRIIKLHQKYAPLGYPVIGINANDPEKIPEDSYENMKKRAKEKNYPFDYLFDNTQEIAKTYGATRTPYVFLLERMKNNDLIVRYIGAIDDNPRDANDVEEKYVENAIDAVEKGKKPDPSFTKAIGCAIKWKEM